MGALWPIFNRAATASIWFGVQSWIGGECVYTLLLAIFPSIASLANGIPNSVSLNYYDTLIHIEGDTNSDSATNREPTPLI